MTEETSHAWQATDLNDVFEISGGAARSITSRKHLLDRDKSLMTKINCGHCNALNDGPGYLKIVLYTRDFFLNTEIYYLLCTHCQSRFSAEKDKD